MVLGHRIIQNKLRMQHHISQNINRKLIRFYHAACFSSPVATWIDSIKNNRFSTCPTLTAPEAKV